MNEEDYNLLRLVNRSYEQWTGQPLPVPDRMANQRFRWLDEASPYALLVQSTEEEPLFIYANQQAQRIFGYSLAEFLKTPASKSAPLENLEGRRQMLQEVAKKGIFEGYQGTRIDKQGNLFKITNGSIWKVMNSSDEVVGTAAMVWQDSTSLG